MINNIQVFLASIILILLLFWQNHIVLSILCLFSVFIGLKQFFADKSELSKAQYYCRTKKVKKFSTKKTLFKLLLFIVLISPFALSYMIYGSFFETKIFMELGLYYYATLIVFHISEFYYKFINSIRCFKEGIKIPGREKEIIPWQDISHIEIKESSLFLEFDNTSISILLNNKDIEDMNAIIQIWKSKKLNHYLVREE